jgi:acylpyruvate hydrolase
MLLVTIDDAPGGSAGAQLASGEILHLGRAAESGTIEAWLPSSVMGILVGGPEGLAVAERLAARHEAMGQASLTPKRAQGALLPPDTRLLAPVPSPGMILAAGLAYRSHLAEMSGTPTPTHPTAFLKSPSSISGPGATVTLPPQAPDHVDYEGELAIVIGRGCHAVDAEAAMQCIAGYTIANDLSARDWLKEVWAAEKPWQARQTWEVNIMGKQLPGFTALGPAIATVGRINDPNPLRLVTRVNGAMMQDASISDMIFPIGETIAYFSRWYRFRPGDVLLTGTPAGVGVGRKPPVFLRAGDRVDVSIDRIGTLTTHVSR